MIHRRDIHGKRHRRSRTHFDRYFRRWRWLSRRQWSSLCRMKNIFRVVIKRFKKFGRRRTRRPSSGKPRLFMSPSKKKSCTHIYTFRDREVDVVEAYDGCDQLRIAVRRNSSAGVAGEPRIVYPKRVLSRLSQLDQLKTKESSTESSNSKDSAVITSLIIGSDRDSSMDGLCRKDRERGGAAHFRVSSDDDDVDEKTTTKTIDSQNPSSSSITSDHAHLMESSTLSSGSGFVSLDDGSLDINHPSADFSMVHKLSSNNSLVSESLSIMSTDANSAIDDLDDNGGRGTAIIGIGTNSQLDVHLSEASNKLQFYYQNNFDRKHHECHDKLKALIDVLNQVLKKMRDLCKVSDLRNLDESVARRLLAAQRELIVLEDVVWKIRDAAQRHGYSCGVKESLDDMAITLYCLRQMHRRQDILIQEIIVARHQNIELMKIIEAFRVAAQNPPIVRVSTMSMNNSTAHQADEDYRINEPYTVTTLDESVPSQQQVPLPPANSSSPETAIYNTSKINFKVSSDGPASSSSKSGNLMKPSLDNSPPSSSSMFGCWSLDSRPSYLTEWFYSCTVRVHCSTSVVLTVMTAAFVVFLGVLMLVTPINLSREPVNECPSAMSSWWNLSNFFALIRSSGNGQPPPT